MPNQQDVEDVAQEAYLRAYVAEQKKEIDQPKAFLFTIAKNIALNKLSQKSMQITGYLEDKPELEGVIESPSAYEVAAAHEDFRNYCSAVVGLKGKVREAFLLRKVHGSSHKEIAEKMNVSISSVEKYLRQATIVLSKTLASDTNPALNAHSLSGGKRK